MRVTHYHVPSPLLAGPDTMQLGRPSPLQMQASLASPGGGGSGDGDADSGLSGLSTPQAANSSLPYSTDTQQQGAKSATASRDGVAFASPMAWQGIGLAMQLNPMCTHGLKTWTTPQALAAAARHGQHLDVVDSDNLDDVSFWARSDQHEPSSDVVKAATALIAHQQQHATPVPFASSQAQASALTGLADGMQTATRSNPLYESEEGMCAACCDDACSDDVSPLRRTPTPSMLGRAQARTTVQAQQQQRHSSSSTLGTYADRQAQTTQRSTPVDATAARATAMSAAAGAIRDSVATEGGSTATRRQLLANLGVELQQLEGETDPGSPLYSVVVTMRFLVQQAESDMLMARPGGTVDGTTLQAGGSGGGLHEAGTQTSVPQGDATQSRPMQTVLSLSRGGGVEGGVESVDGVDVQQGQQQQRMQQQQGQGRQQGQSQQQQGQQQQQQGQKQQQMQQQQGQQQQQQHPLAAPLSQLPTGISDLCRRLLLSPRQREALQRSLASPACSEGGPSSGALKAELPNGGLLPPKELPNGRISREYWARARMAGAVAAGVTGRSTASVGSLAHVFEAVEDEAQSSDTEVHARQQVLLSRRVLHPPGGAASGGLPAPTDLVRAFGSAPAQGSSQQLPGSSPEARQKLSGTSSATPQKLPGSFPKAQASVGGMHAARATARAPPPQLPAGRARDVASAASAAASGGARASPKSRPTAAATASPSAAPSPNARRSQAASRPSPSPATAPAPHARRSPKAPTPSASSPPPTPARTLLLLAAATAAGVLNGPQEPEQHAGATPLPALPASGQPQAAAGGLRTPPESPMRAAPALRQQQRQADVPLRSVQPQAAAAAAGGLRTPPESPMRAAAAAARVLQTPPESPMQAAPASRQQQQQQGKQLQQQATRPPNAKLQDATDGATAYLASLRVGPLGLPPAPAHGGARAVLPAKVELQQQAQQQQQQQQQQTQLPMAVHVLPLRSAQQHVQQVQQQQQVQLPLAAHVLSLQTAQQQAQAQHQHDRHHQAHAQQRELRSPPESPLAGGSRLPRQHHSPIRATAPSGTAGLAQRGGHSAAGWAAAAWEGATVGTKFWSIQQQPAPVGRDEVKVGEGKAAGAAATAAGVGAKCAVGAAPGGAVRSTQQHQPQAAVAGDGKAGGGDKTAAVSGSSGRGTVKQRRGASAPAARSPAHTQVHTRGGSYAAQAHALVQAAAQAKGAVPHGSKRAAAGPGAGGGVGSHGHAPNAAWAGAVGDSTARAKGGRTAQAAKAPGATGERGGAAGAAAAAAAAAGAGAAGTVVGASGKKQAVGTGGGGKKRRAVAAQPAAAAAAAPDLRRSQDLSGFDFSAGGRAGGQAQPECSSQDLRGYSVATATFSVATAASPDAGVNSGVDARAVADSAGVGRSVGRSAEEWEAVGVDGGVDGGVGGVGRSRRSNANIADAWGAVGVDAGVDAGVDGGVGPAGEELSPICDLRQRFSSASFRDPPSPPPQPQHSEARGVHAFGAAAGQHASASAMATATTASTSDAGGGNAFDVIEAYLQAAYLDIKRQMLNGAALPSPLPTPLPSPFAATSAASGSLSANREVHNHVPLPSPLLAAGLTLGAQHATHHALDEEAPYRQDRTERYGGGTGGTAGGTNPLKERYGGGTGGTAGGTTPLRERYARRAAAPGAVRSSYGAFGGGRGDSLAVHPSSSSGSGVGRRADKPGARAAPAAASAAHGGLAAGGGSGSAARDPKAVPPSSSSSKPSPRAAPPARSAAYDGRATGGRSGAGVGDSMAVHPSSSSGSGGTSAGRRCAFSGGTSGGRRSAFSHTDSSDSVSAIRNDASSGGRARGGGSGGAQYTGRSVIGPLAIAAAAAAAAAGASSARGRGGARHRPLTPDAVSSQRGGASGGSPVCWGSSSRDCVGASVAPLPVEAAAQQGATGGATPAAASARYATGGATPTAAAGAARYATTPHARQYSADDEVVRGALSSGDEYEFGGEEEDPADAAAGAAGVALESRFDATTPVGKAAVGAGAEERAGAHAALAAEEQQQQRGGTWQQQQPQQQHQQQGQQQQRAQQHGGAWQQQQQSQQHRYQQQQEQLRAQQHGGAWQHQQQQQHHQQQDQDQQQEQQHGGAWQRQQPQQHHQQQGQQQQGQRVTAGSSSSGAASRSATSTAASTAEGCDISVRGSLADSLRAAAAARGGCVVAASSSLEFCAHGPASLSPRQQGQQGQQQQGQQQQGQQHYQHPQQEQHQHGQQQGQHEQHQQHQQQQPLVGRPAQKEEEGQGAATHAQEEDLTRASDQDGVATAAAAAAAAANRHHAAVPAGTPAAAAPAAGSAAAATAEAAGALPSRRVSLSGDATQQQQRQEQLQPNVDAGASPQLPPMLRPPPPPSAALSPSLAAAPAAFRGSFEFWSRQLDATLARQAATHHQQKAAGAARAGGGGGGGARSQVGQSVVLQADAKTAATLALGSDSVVAAVGDAGQASDVTNCLPDAAASTVEAPPPQSPPPPNPRSPGVLPVGGRGAVTPLSTSPVGSPQHSKLGCMEACVACATNGSGGASTASTGSGGGGSASVDAARGSHPHAPAHQARSPARGGAGACGSPSLPVLTEEAEEGGGREGGSGSGREGGGGEGGRSGRAGGSAVARLWPFGRDKGVSGSGRGDAGDVLRMPPPAGTGRPPQGGGAQGGDAAGTPGSGPPAGGRGLFARVLNGAGGVPRTPPPTGAGGQQGAGGGDGAVGEDAVRTPEGRPSAAGGLLARVLSSAKKASRIGGKGRAGQ
ncbi:hypothetical protein FOA52_001988 [Chlamydomonas sp. UWO 241]|nr:hypothetical protein FOA52_001988 [Chlamydomonas sp. UWO 241]